jgi:hypothetical protein
MVQAIVSECLLFIREDGFDGAIEEASEFEGEWEARVEFSGLDSVHRLPRDFESLSKIGLTPVAFSAENAEAVFHRYLMRMNG